MSLSELRMFKTVFESKLGLSRVVMGLDKSSTKVSKVALKSYMSSNGPPGNYYKVPNEHIIRHALERQNGGSTNSL